MHPGWAGSHLAQMPTDLASMAAFNEQISLILQLSCLKSNPQLQWID